METKFTPGPWMFTPVGPSDSKGMGVCALWGEPGSDEIIANNHLISCAPEMYEMLEKIAKSTVHDKNYATAKPIFDLLAKARGEQCD